MDPLLVIVLVLVVLWLIGVSVYPIGNIVHLLLVVILIVLLIRWSQGRSV